MTNGNHRFVRGRIQMPLVVFPLLALLLAFLSSITHQQASAARVDHGLIGTLDHLVVASHNESIRAPSGNSKNDAAADGDPDLPDWSRDNPMVLWAELCRNTCIITAGARVPPAATRFLTPLLRAPPLV
ncbi:hypothetical protein [Kineobactrum salinum]|uniref:Uncharacterized protein n=1 Tax=Kineobactrum salinum TaxID=2708301 RepID=A0A6C0TX09_9GAMM|nr:hypothetical protein [Kineobactrum salinum]QIB64362.1 hypothetical protein G3T16_02010 [Kineobactrum salinum]